MATPFSAEQAKAAAEELAARGITVRPPQGMAPEAVQGTRALQRTLQNKQLTGAINVQDAVNELNRRGVNVKLATAEKRDAATIAKENEDAEYLIGSLHPDPAVRAATLEKKAGRDLESAYVQSIGDLPESFQEPQGITPATFDDWYAAEVAPRINERVNAFQGSDAQRAQFQNQLEEASRNSPTLQERYRMYSVEAKMRPREIMRGTPEYNAKLRSDLTTKLQENAVRAAQVKAIPDVITAKAKSDAEAPQRQAKAEMDLRKETEANTALKNFRLRQDAVNTVEALATKPNPTNADDLSLIYSYVKLLDPGSVVREGEIALTQKATPLTQNLVRSYNRLYSDKNGILDAPTRANYLGAAQAVAESAKESVRSEFEKYRGVAERDGIPLDKIFNSTEMQIFHNAQPAAAAAPAPAQAAPAATPAAKPAAAPSGGAIRIQNGFRYQRGANGQWQPIGPA